MIVAETGIDSPLSAESVCASPGKEASKSEKKNGERDLLGPRGPFPETDLSQKTIGDADQEDAP
jgi:hypothetical protein